MPVRLLDIASNLLQAGVDASKAARILAQVGLDEANHKKECNARLRPVEEVENAVDCKLRLQDAANKTQSLGNTSEDEERLGKFIKSDAA